MKTFLILLTILSLCPAFAADDGRIQGFELNPNIVHTIYIYPKGEYPTTVMLPGPIEKVYASKVITDQAAVGQKTLIHPFIISHDLGSNFFTVKSISQAQEKGGLNVIYNGQVYIIDLEVAPKGYRSVTYNLPKPLATSTQRSLPATPQIIASHLDKAKSYHLFKKQMPEQIRDMPFKAFNKVVKYGNNYSIRLVEVISSPRIDTLYFHVELINHTSNKLSYNPRHFAANISDRIFYSSLIDASGVIPADGSSHAWFAVTGDSKGGKGKLRPDNDWTILLPVKVPQLSHLLIPKSIEEPKKEAIRRQVRQILKEDSKRQVRQILKEDSKRQIRKEVKRNLPVEYKVSIEPNPIEKVTKPIKKSIEKANPIEKANSIENSKAKEPLRKIRQIRIMRPIEKETDK